MSGLSAVNFINDFEFTAAANDLRQRTAASWTNTIVCRSLLRGYCVSSFPCRLHDNVAIQSQHPKKTLHVIDNARDYRTFGVQSSYRKYPAKSTKWHSRGKRKCIKFSFGTKLDDNLGGPVPPQVPHSYAREPRSPDTCIPIVRPPAGIPSSAHVSIRIRILFSAWFAFTVMTTALDSDERLHSDVGLKQERESKTDLDIIQSAYGRMNYLKRRRR